MKIPNANPCTNFRSFLPKVNELTLLLSTIKPLIVCLTETWITPSISDPEESLDSYTLFRSSRAVPRRGGGVAF